MALGVLVLGLASCKRPESKAPEAEAAPDAPVVAEKTPPPEKVEVHPPLSSRALAQVGRMGALIQIPDQPYQQGILIEGAGSDSSARNYLVIGHVPSGIDSVGVACQGGGQIEKVFAKRISNLPSGLSLFGFTSRLSLQSARPADPVAGESFHAVRMTGEGTVPADEIAELTTELESIANESRELQSRRPDPSSRMMPPDIRNRRDPRDRGREIQQEMISRRAEMEALAARRSGINARLKLPISSILPVEVAAAADLDALELAGQKLDDTLLGTSSGKLRAIRFQGKWVELNEIFASSADQVESVKIDLSGSRDSAQLDLPARAHATVFGKLLFHGRRHDL